MLVIARAGELPPERRIWGTGGWLAPEEREGLDWLALARLLGWSAELAPASRELDPAALAERRWVVVASDPDKLFESCAEQLGACLREAPLALVTRAAAPRTPLARLAGASRGSEPIAGRDLRWTGPGPPLALRCREPVAGFRLDLAPTVEVWARLDGAPLVAARALGRGRVVTLAFHPSAARDAAGAFTALAKRVLVGASLEPVAWLEQGGALALRMDDPGGAQSVYCRSWRHPKLGPDEWEALGAALGRRRARLSIGYVAGFVDDGDPARGTLYVDGAAAARAPGRVHPAPAVRYEERAGHAPGTVSDGAAEYRGIQRLRAAGLAEVELHGYTHMHPDPKAWARAPDRYEAVAWYRELGRAASPILAAAPAARHPLALGLAAFERWFATRPVALVNPGDEWTDEVLERALALGLELVSSYYLALRDGERFCWVQHVCSPYLDLPDAAWFDAELPVVATFHDRDVALHGVGWVEDWLERWEAAGARRLVDLRELAAALRLRLRLAGDGSGLVLRGAQASLPRPVPVGLWAPGRRLPTQIALEGATTLLPVEELRPGLGRARLPAGPLAPAEARPSYFSAALACEDRSGGRAA